MNTLYYLEWKLLGKKKFGNNNNYNRNFWVYEFEFEKNRIICGRI